MTYGSSSLLATISCFSLFVLLFDCSAARLMEEEAKRDEQDLKARAAMFAAGGESGVKERKRSLLHNVSCAVDSRIVWFFDGLGRFLSWRPYLVISLVIMLTVGSGVAFFALFKQELDGIDLFCPSGVQSLLDREFVVDTFGEPGHEVRVLVSKTPELRTDSDCNKRNLFVNSSHAKSVLLDYMSLYEAIESQSITYKGKVFTLQDVCQKPDPSLEACKTRSILDVWEYSREKLEADKDVLETMENAMKSGEIRGKFGFPIAPGFVVGLNKANDGCKFNVEVLQMSFTLQNDPVEINGGTNDPESTAWTFKLVDTVIRDWKNDNDLAGYVSSTDAVERESDRVVHKDLSKLAIGYILVIVFSHWILFRDSPVFCKAHLALVSVVSIAMSMVTAYGIAQMFGVRFNMVVQSLAFILLGLGMDDTFVIMGAYHSTSLHQSVEDRMAQTMARAGSSILVTSVTDMLAFMIGTYTDLPALKAFAIYAFLGVMFDFIYQVTFFTAFVVLDARREHRAMNGAPLLGIQFGCTETQFDSVPPMQVPKCENVGRGGDHHNKRQPSNIINGKNWRRRIFSCQQGDYDPQSPSLTTKIIGEWLPRVTLHPVGSALVVLIEAVVLAGAIYGCTKVKMDFRYREWFVPDGSYLKNAFDVEKTYFFGDQQPFSVFTKQPLDGKDFFYHQDDYLDLINAVRHEQYVGKLPPVTSWYEDFSRWLVSEKSPFLDDIDKSTGRAPNATAFTAWVQHYLNDPAGVFYNGSVLFGPDGIEATKFAAYTLDIKDGSFAVATVDSIRGAVKAAAPLLDPVAYTTNFLVYDGFKVITWETIRNVLMAGVAVFVITTLVLADLQAATIVTLMIAFTDIVLFGFLWYADLTFNTVTAINMVVAVGLAVDYSAHIAHSFLVLDGSHKQRAQGALHHIGGEVFAGAFTTWLAVMVMGAGEHYIFKVFFRMFCAIIVTGAWHGIVLLPIVLRFFGPKSYVCGTSSH